MAGAVDLPGLLFVAEQGSKGASMQPGFLQQGAGQGDPCARLRQQLGLPGPWSLGTTHLACVSVLLCAGAGLTSPQWHQVQLSCAQLRSQQVGGPGWGAVQRCFCAPSIVPCRKRPELPEALTTYGLSFQPIAGLLSYARALADTHG